MTTATPQLIQATLQQLNAVILGKEHTVKLALACLLADGHLLLEDLPGMGKTTLAHALSQVCGLAYQRVQFTSDLLPADLIGASIFEPANSAFRFHQGPIFSQVVLADELNRATPKAQSALLEAMEEHPSNSLLVPLILDYSMARQLGTKSHIRDLEYTRMYS